MTPRAVIGRVHAMARPRRPASEAEAVRLAAGPEGSAAARARALARRVAAAALADVDREDDAALSILQALAPTPVDLLATCPLIGASPMIVAERVRALEARGGRRLPPIAWQAEDRAIIARVAARLARRYARHLADI